MTYYDEVIIVCGHGVCILPEQPHSHSSWVGLYDYPEEADLLVDHIKKGVELTDSNPKSILFFSGGATRNTPTELSEAMSYFNIAEAANWWNKSMVKQRCILENQARDSLGNIVLSLAEFRSKLGYYPSKLSVVGFKFKEQRFRLHAEAINWRNDFNYYGINNPPARDGILKKAEEGESKKRDALKEDPFLLGIQWSTQRRLRNPFNNPIPSFKDIPQLQNFIEYLYLKDYIALPNWKKGGDYVNSAN